jgi:hypothetical protein
MKETGTDVRKIQENIPKLTTSHYFARARESGKMEAREKKEALKYREDSDLEMQLKDIQEKLRALQA